MDASSGWRGGILQGHGSPAVVVGWFLGSFGAIVPTGFLAQEHVGVPTSVAWSLTGATVAAPLVLSVLLAIHLNGPDDENLVRDLYLCRAAISLRLLSARAALYHWLQCLLGAATAGVLFGVGSVLRGTPVSVMLAGWHEVAAALALALVVTLHWLVLASSICLAFGDRRLSSAASISHLLALILLAGLGPDSHGRLVAEALPGAPMWSRFSSAEVGPLAIQMSTGELAANVIFWMALSAVVWARVILCGGLSIRDWALTARLPHRA